LITHPEVQAHRLDLEATDPGVTIHRLSFLPFHGDMES
jgi:hypothetical protein